MVSNLIWHCQLHLDILYESGQAWVYPPVYNHVLKFLKSLFFLLRIVFKGFVIQGGSRGTILLISFGMKFDIIFKKVLLVNVLTCQLGSWLILSCWSQLGSWLILSCWSQLGSWLILSCWSQLGSWLILSCWSQLGSWLILSCWSQVKLDMHLLRRHVSFVIMSNFSFKRWGRRYVKLFFQKVGEEVC